MSEVSDTKTPSRIGECFSDAFALLAVALLFGSALAILQFYQPVLAWMAEDPLLHTTLVVAALVLDVLLILGLLMFGSACLCRGNERCFGTFRGRRNHQDGMGLVGHLIDHVENVGKKHR
jgi:hypothetical protein